MAKKKAVLIYITDPMCSWCYGFSPEISKIGLALKDACSLKLIMGGLRPYNTETMADLSGLLKEHWEHVAAASNVEFNYKILGDNSFIYDTEPPARAVVAIRTLNPNLEFKFFQAVQKAFYADNKNTNDIYTYLEILTDFEIEEHAFTELYESEKMKEAVRTDFQMARTLGVRGFPSTILIFNDQYHPTSNGFLKAEKLIENIQNILSAPAM